jgi:hypothetical protein
MEGKGDLPWPGPLSAQSIDFLMDPADMVGLTDCSEPELLDLLRRPVSPLRDLGTSSFSLNCGIGLMKERRVY